MNGIFLFLCKEVSPLKHIKLKPQSISVSAPVLIYYLLKSLSFNIILESRGRKYTHGGTLPTGPTCWWRVLQ